MSFFFFFFEHEEIKMLLFYISQTTLLLPTGKKMYFFQTFEILDTRLCLHRIFLFWLGIPSPSVQIRKLKKTTTQKLYGCDFNVPSVIYSFIQALHSMSEIVPLN